MTLILDAPGNTSMASQSTSENKFEYEGWKVFKCAYMDHRPKCNEQLAAMRMGSSRRYIALSKSSEGSFRLS